MMPKPSRTEYDANQSVRMSINGERRKKRAKTGLRGGAEREME